MRLQRVVSDYSDRRLRIASCELLGEFAGRKIGTLQFNNAAAAALKISRLSQEAFSDTHLAGVICSVLPASSRPQ